MTRPWIEQLRDWNPQMEREFKGRLKPRNILIAVAISLIGQLLVLIGFSSQIPTPPPIGEYSHTITSRYCIGKLPYEGSLDNFCVRVAGGSFEINWQLWWNDVFIGLSIVGIFALLLVGTYMLIADLSKEERRGTLNFLRLAPQSSLSILSGKLLGVPIILYLVSFLALPLHIAAGLSGQVPLSLILAYYGVLGVSCLFFYSVALLFGLVGRWLGGFQAWLGSGAMLVFLYGGVVMFGTGANRVTHYPTDWLTLFNPSAVLPYLIGSNSLDAANPSYVEGLSSLSWFYLPIGVSAWSLAGFMLLNYGVWTYWVWQGLKRCFHNPTATLLGKQQSYWLTACFQVVLLGFGLNPPTFTRYPEGIARADLFNSLSCLLVFNLLLFLVLIVALSPQRQALQDWARYRHQQQASRKRSVIADLIWGEKSPAIVAVMLNAAIALSILLPWILLWSTSASYKAPAVWALLLNMSLIGIYASIAQLMLFMKNQKRASWAAVTLGSLIFALPIVFGLLSADPSKNPGVWLFTAFPWVAVENTSSMAVFLAIIGQSLTLGLLNIQLARRLQKAGESSTKALLSRRPPVAIQ